MSIFNSALRTASTLAILAAVSAPIALAQDTEERESAVDKVLGKITVTATKSADVEDVQSVPVAVTAFNSDSLEALKVRDMKDLSYSTPNVTLTDVGTARGTANFAMRGLGVNSSIPSIDPTVGVFVDGVYLGVNNGVVFDLFDLDSVELVRGPQGLLFGRNTTGGAVLLNTGNPTDEFRAKARFAIEGPAASDRGSFATYTQATVSGPIVKDVLNFKLGGYYNDDKGYFQNLYDGSDHGAAETTIVRGALEFMPTSNLNFLLKAEQFQSNGQGPSAQNHGVYSRDSFDFSIDNAGDYDNESTFVSLKGEWDIGFGDGTITSITGYRKYDATTNGDIDASPAANFHSESELAQEQISEELRYNGTFGNLDITTGLYWFNQTVDYTEVRHLIYVPALQNFFYNMYGGGGQDHTVYGAFGQVDWHMTDKFTFTTGLRYSQEEKEANLSYIIPRTPCSVVDGTCADNVVDDRTWDSWTPKFGAQYQYNDLTQIYASYTQGTRSGGYNFRITDPAAFLDQIASTGSPAFDQEKVGAMEAGIKFETPNGKGQLNTSVFHTTIDNMQREVNLPSPTAGVAQFILNTADATINGLEVEGRYAVLDNLLLSANVGVIDASYDKILYDISGDGVVGTVDEKLDLPRVPPLTWGLGAIYDLDLGSAGSLVARVSYQFRDKNYYTDNNRGFFNKVNMLDMNLAYNTPVDGLSVALYGKNLLDEVQYGGDTILPASVGGGTFSPLSKGALAGLELTYSY